MSRKPEEATDLGYEFIGKAKLSKGFGFPMKRSVLDEFLRRERITNVTGVGFCGNSGHNVVLGADYFGPRSNYSRHTLTLWIYAVPSDIRRPIGELVVSAALPRLAEWLLSFRDDSLLRAKTDHSTSFSLEGASVGDRPVFPVGSGDLRLIQSADRVRTLK